jgi:phenylalanyl-tRNA synthetase beta chain
MKVNEQWLREWVNPEVSVETLVEQLTMAGLEVDALSALGGDFSGVVVAQVISTAAHPDAKKLQVCQVDDGAGQYQVVCGAPNVAPGVKVPFARVDAQLPDGLIIKQASLRGVDSFGMLCGASELGLSDDDSGLMLLPDDAAVGLALQDWLGLPDHVIELDITPNRGDCFNVVGIARELAVINQTPLRPVVVDAVAAQLGERMPVTVRAAAHCPRYCARIVRGVDVSRPSPQWLQEKLRRVGLRPIDPVVDITNYVLMELGQPMHAFDLNTLSGEIIVRLADEGESLTLLDGQKVALNAETLVIADGTGVQAIAGIMGGRDSGVSERTCDIVLESAFFTPELLAGKARHYGLHTDSSHRFERGVDATGQHRALERATALLLEITGGQPGPIVECVSEEHLPPTPRITLRKKRVQQVLGLDLADEVVLDILQRLGFSVAHQDTEAWQLLAPSWRFDMAIEADLLEELARIYGYNRLPVAPLQAPLNLARQSESSVDKQVIQQQLLARGYQEVITYSFIAPQLQQLFAPLEASIELANPLSADMGMMRQSLWPGLVTTILYNLNRQQNRLRLFETGLRFVRVDGATEQTAVLAAAITGSRYPESWASNGEAVDFFDLKGDLEALFSLSGDPSKYRMVAAQHKALHDGQSARIYCGEQAVGWIGRLHPQVERSLSLDQAVYLFEIELEAISQVRLPEFRELSKFPEVRRDIALIVDESLAVEALLQCIREEIGEIVTKLRVFDVYQGEGIDKQSKSLALGLTFRDRCRTLNDSQVNDLIDRIVTVLAHRFGAVLRN